VLGNNISNKLIANDAHLSLSDKYDMPCPRYTSYPTAAEFMPFNEVQAQANIKALSNDGLHGGLNPSNNEALALYVHIPFCESICLYCSCNKIVTKNKQAAQTYLQYLMKEMFLLSKGDLRQRKITQLHLGGGTPTYFDGGQLTQLMQALSQHFSLVTDDNREYSIEVDPRTVDNEKLALLKGLGFNRISFGVQDFSEDVN